VRPLFSHPTYIIPQSYAFVKFLAGALGRNWQSSNYAEIPSPPGGFVMVSGAVLCYCVMGKGGDVTEDVTLKSVDSIEEKDIFFG